LVLPDALNRDCDALRLWSPAGSVVRLTVTPANSIARSNRFNLEVVVLHDLDKWRAAWQR